MKKIIIIFLFIGITVGGVFSIDSSFLSNSSSTVTLQPTQTIQIVSKAKDIQQENSVLQKKANKLKEDLKDIQKKNSSLQKKLQEEESVGIKRNQDGSITLSSSMTIKLANKINNLEYKNEKLKELVDIYEESLEEERELNKELQQKYQDALKTQGMNIWQKLVYFTTGAATAIVLQELLGGGE